MNFDFNPEDYIAKVMTAEEWRRTLDMDFGDGWYVYHGKEYYVDRMSETWIELFCRNTDAFIKCTSVEEAMTVPFFDGHSLEEIAEEFEPF